MEEEAKLLILYASQTGNALDAAERLGREAERRGCPVTVLSMDDFDLSSLPNKKTVVFVVSTTGQGDAPDSMKMFWKKLLQRNLNQHWLEGVHYAVFGLGDSAYQKYNVMTLQFYLSLQNYGTSFSLDKLLTFVAVLFFIVKFYRSSAYISKPVDVIYQNFVAKKLDKRISDLGATTIIERGLGDDQHPSGLQSLVGPLKELTVINVGTVYGVMSDRFSRHCVVVSDRVKTLYGYGRPM
ncbi:hypothetical protein TEA_018009 [Camellia sinensis var. sinensis]|uniref:Flavodoxin-like domain-containing protein n=1 Tax=Camellia sinensis var. sinensis TaxID=542762 RepID=A0A4S4ECL9_CAMSN|nr:hypothetical protein TEA_018009 [Camellia sinensis var. sinensis]